MSLCWRKLCTAWTGPLLGTAGTGSEQGWGHELWASAFLSVPSNRRWYPVTHPRPDHSFQSLLLYFLGSSMAMLSGQLGCAVPAGGSGSHYCLAQGKGRFLPEELSCSIGSPCLLHFSIFSFLLLQAAYSEQLLRIWAAEQKFCTLTIQFSVLLGVVLMCRNFTGNVPLRSQFIWNFLFGSLEEFWN